MFDDQTEVVDGEVIDHSHDKIFFFTFGGVLAFLFALTVVIFIIAAAISSDDDASLNPVVKARVDSNTAPIGAVYTDAAAIPVAAPAAAAAPRSTDEIVNGVCGACHGSGVLGATKLDDTAGWKARLDAAGGVDGLVSAALAGKGSMPPKGGDASLSEEELRAAVEAMLKQAGI